MLLCTQLSDVCARANDAYILGSTCSDTPMVCHDWCSLTRTMYNVVVYDADTLRVF